MNYKVDSQTRDFIIESLKTFKGIIDKLEYPICIINADELFPKKDENDENKIIDYNNYVKKLTKNK